ncbi:MAG: hypothetical protein Q4F50_07070 [Bacteroides sp.]|uniref:hypothetical protein n=1 Tax=Bacteroides sp. TaxID=29523 RepID=UPI0026E0DE38|nr:hypothetical protein [Bacteroides sp.]MDO5419806.1 hypothetical protein [Bacteroides sp.]
MERTTTGDPAKVGWAVKGGLQRKEKKRVEVFFFSLFGLERENGTNIQERGFSLVH